jgi:prepilin-type N-terminal cleavage/methylation domain-containing protein
MRTKNAFTLVELLVVISIIALLLAVLMPALSKAREQGRMVLCRSNSKQLLLGAALWSNAHDDWTLAGDWYKDVGKNEIESSLAPYIGATDPNKENSIKVCPTAVHAKFFKTDKNFKSSETRYTFAVNGYLTYDMSQCGEGSPGRKGDKVVSSGPFGGSSGGWTGGGVYWTEHGFNKLSEIRQPAETVYFIDHEYYFVNSWVFDPTKSIAELTREHPDYKFNTRWHQKKPNNDYGVGNIGWVDGHSSVEPRDLASKITSGASARTGADLTKKYSRWHYYFWNH